MEETPPQPLPEKPATAPAPAPSSSEAPPTTTAASPPQTLTPTPSQPPPPAPEPPPPSSSTSTPTITTQNPQNLQIPTQNQPQAQQRLSLGRIRPQSPYPHFSSSPSSSSSSAPSSSSSFPIPSSSSSPSLVQRGGLAIGVPAHHPRPSQPPVTLPPFGPSPSFSQPFSPLHRGTEQSPASNAQVRQPMPGIQNIGMIGSLSTASQMRPTAVSGPQPQRLGQPPVRSASPSANQALNPQKFPSHGLSRASSMAPNSASVLPQGQQPVQQSMISPQGKQMHAPSMPSSSYRPQAQPHVLQPRPYHLQQSLPATSHQQNMPSSQQHLQQKQVHQQQQQPPLVSHLAQEQHNQQYLAHRNQQLQQQSARAPASTANKSNSPVLLQAGVAQSGTTTPIVTTDASESGTHILSKRSIQELVTQIDPSEKLESDVEDVLIEIAEDFLESITTYACSLAKHRKSTMLESKDILLHVERSWNMTMPGFGGDEIKCYKKQHMNDIHKERLTVIKKSIGTSDSGNAKNSAAVQAAANQKSHTPKASLVGSPNA
ncbi:transcription initiation factor TFIID subunit 12 isoform X1 [Typha latifolia]|uniref:transcription initiation factor TFIID subunit 12 isoform X1 n=1 Tax=Typha latifolia TaxID=4733 RepID=UPI003C2CD00F